MTTSVKSDPRIKGKLAMDGGRPVRRRPFADETPGALWYDKEEIDAVSEVLKRRSPFRYYGLDVVGAVDGFEKRFARFMKRKHALAVNSGTSALMAGLAALGVGPGQEVIVPGYMWIATVTAAVRLGAMPVLAEVDETLTMDPKDLARKITPRTSVVIPVHMRGMPCRMDAIMRIARKAKVAVLEDTAQAAGGSFKGRPLGSWGDVGIYSLQLNKNMTTGEGGMLVTDDDRLYRRAFAFHDMGYPREGGIASASKDAEVIWGNGSRMTEMQGALGLVQLGKLRKIVGAMRRAKYRIRRAIADLPGVRVSPVNDEKGDTGPALMTLHETPEAAHRFCDALRAEGIPGNCVENSGLHIYYHMASLVEKLSISADGYPWTHPANAHAKGYEYGRGALPQSDDLFERTVSCPIPSKLADGDVRDIIVAYRKVALAPAK